jgi:pimeloyl-ACP methyl ester carboxylesterase
MGIAALLFLPALARAETVKLKNGMELEGAAGSIASLNQNPLITPPDVKLIRFVNDELRRIFFGNNQLAAVGESAGRIAQVRIPVEQRVAIAGRPILAVGPIVRVEPFDAMGRRIFTFIGHEGKEVSVIQGITLVTPKYILLEGLQTQGRPAYIWSTRIATSSIPREQLTRVLLGAAGKGDPDRRLKIVQLYMQAERIQDARIELESLIKDFPELAKLNDMVVELRQSSAKRLLDEIELRRSAGQPLLAIAMLRGFPKEGVAGELLLKVKDMLGEFEETHKRGEKVVALLKEHQAAVDPKAAESVKPICDEIVAELNIHNLDRMADYLRLADDATLSAEQKLSLAISGWLLGSGAGIDNLAVSRSLVDTRKLVRAYLNSRLAAERKAILDQLAGLEGATVANVDRIVKHMTPPYDENAVINQESVDVGDLEGILGPPAGKGDGGKKALPASRTKAAGRAPTDQPPRPAAAAAPRQPDGACGPEQPAEPQPETDSNDNAPAPAAPEIPGFFELTCKGPSEHPVIRYFVQLPPEYNPYRRYPLIITLNGAGTTPRLQIDWWAGGFNKQMNMRAGQATRHGYIVVAPVWQKEYQRKYEYSLREHACVLNTLRDAMRRFSVDTDRVFLSGHSMGGDAAWDIGLAHPDLWAGVIPIVATADKYVRFYRANAERLPMYFVSGERDGNRLADNAPEWDHYLTRSSVRGWDIMVSQYIGRGHENFHDEIQTLFEWMNLHVRNFFPDEFEMASMRPWDNFFWYAEAAGFPDSSMVHPVEFTGEKPPRSNPAKVSGKRIVENNGVNVTSTASKVTVWLSPELVNFDAKMLVKIKGKDMRGPFKPKLEDLLEDVRTRCDRQHAFWLKVTN